MSARSHDAARGFTLLEMLMVVLFTGIVLTFAASFYIDLSNASRDALAESVDLRRATTVLDRVARDLESAALVKKPDALDPLEHPWLFLAEGRGSDGAERLRFQARNHRPRMGAQHESDRVEIAYWLAESEDGEGFDLLRWSSARPPVPPLDRNFPRRDDPGVERLASRVALFAVRLQDEDGAWQSAWDSWSPAQSSQLPIAAEVSVALLPEEQVEDENLAQPEPELFMRPVVFALDPLDLEQALGAESGDDQDEEEDDLACVTVAECVSRNQAVVDGYLAQNPDLQGILASIADQCWKDHAGSVPVAVTNCE
jgi:type II secretory pathway pseudopilin PulG